MSDPFADDLLSKHGGPVHPAEWPAPGGGTISSSGMSLRDWFAGQAIPAIQRRGYDMFVNDEEDLSNSDIATAAYALADAMLAARQKDGAS